ncbi:hypothetical protein [Rhodovulum sulfidophilum]|uniref:hypothetical protein n=1 Tax=Rhodovulum sulfidophilum TaxID=35806 RepID=UPI0013899977|nr:hypothetical protein [Rhodovulum sulfidophilum]NDK34987.1 hypothetical protein [Rhodovulum sulfidophilum]
MASLGSAREAAALILSIAIRPCTGALVLLTIAFGLRIPLAGILATLAMGAGTAALNAIAISGAALRIAGGLIIIVLTLGFGL